MADGPWPGASTSGGPIPAGGGDSGPGLYEWLVGVVEKQSPGRSTTCWAGLRPVGAFG